MKKVYLISVVVLSVFAFFSCKEKTNLPIEDIYFGWVPEEEAILTKYGIGTDGVFVGVNNTKVTSVIQEPVYAEWVFVNYSTSDSAVVTVSADGVLTGVGKGIAEVYAQIGSEKDGNLKKASLKVYVDTIQVTKIAIDIAANSFSDYSKIGPLKGADGQDSTVTENGALKVVEGSIENTDTLFLNDRAVMQSTIEPLDASFTEMIWTTDRPDVFDIKGDTITAIAEGSGKIYGRMKQNHPEELTIEYNWNVKTEPLERVVWTAGSHKMYGNTSEDVYKLIVYVPSFASDKNVTFSSSNPELFGVANGKVYCYSNKSGEQAVLTVSAPQATEGQEDVCTFKIK
ncbi:MAG: hypothetical protein IKU78_08230 [Paludibacteraceae bacterium]|nr:hypothetical protein [Paludibacteraceae bacterium]